MIPNLPIRKMTAPKAVDKKLTFKPAANIPTEISPMASIASKAEIKPNICPRHPQTSANKVIELTRPIIFVEVPFLTNPLPNSTRVKIKSNNRGYINTGPPSFSKFIAFFLSE